MVADTFNRADGGLGANWTTDVGTAPTIVTNAAKGNSGGYSSAHWSANTFAAAQSAQVVRGANHYSGPAVRCSANNFYWFHSASEVHRMVAGTVTSLGVIGASVAGDTMKLSISGSTLEVFVNGVSQGTLTDASLASGSVGIGFYGTTGTQDNWEGTGEVVAPAADIVFNMQIG